MSEHTKEPWTITDADDNVWIRGADGKPLMTRMSPGEPRRPNRERDANAFRIVAAVNACDGIPTESLTPGLVAEMRDAAKALADKVDSTSDCDHKRASCDEVGCIGHEVKAVRFILAKLKGH